MEKERSFNDLEIYFFKDIMEYLEIRDVVKLSSVSKPVRNKIKTLMIKDFKLNFIDSKNNITKNFFKIIRNNFDRRIIKVNKSDLGLFLTNPRALKVLPEVKPLLSGQRILDIKVGPKLCGLLTDKGCAYVYTVEEIEKLNLEPGMTIKEVKSFEVAGPLIFEEGTKLKMLNFPSKEGKWGTVVEFPNYLDDKHQHHYLWSSCYEFIAICYQTEEKGSHIFIVNFNKLDEPVHELQCKETLSQITMSKGRLVTIDALGSMTHWNLDSIAKPEKYGDVKFKETFTNNVFSFLFAKNNQMKKLKDLSTEELYAWFTMLKLEKFEDIIKFNKVTGLMLSKMTHDDLEGLFGYPSNSPEMSQLIVNNRLLDFDYFLNPGLYANGYNGNNELGINTGNNVMKEVSEFELKLDDKDDDIESIKMNGFTSILRTKKQRTYITFDYEEQLDTLKKEAAEKLLEDAEESDSSDEGKGKGKGKKSKASKRKNSESGKGKIRNEKPVQTKSAKKFDKVRWKEVTKLLEDNKFLKPYHIDYIEASKNSLLLICHEKVLAVDSEGRRERFLSIKEAVNKVMCDKKLSKHEFRIGIRHK